MDKQPVWFITGASKGFGLSLVKQLPPTGARVAATTRNLQELVNAVGSSDSNFLPLQVDLSNEASVAAAIRQTHERFGRLDVVVNNAGYGLSGSVEELSDDLTRANFDVNVFGTLNVIRHAMPILRAQRSGRVINIASIGGLTVVPGWDIYCATKFAVIGLSEALAEDVKEFGVHVTVVAPGGFRTRFLSPESMVLTPTPIADYTLVNETRRRFQLINGQQAGDPDKAASAIIRLASESQPPVVLLLGTDALTRARKKLEHLSREIDAWETVTRSTDFQTEAALA